MNLSKNSKAVVISNAVAAGTSDLTSLGSVDMQNYESVMFIIQFGAIVSGAATSVKAQQSADDSSFADLEGTSQTVLDTEDSTAFIIDINKALDRYVRPVILRATQNSTVESVTAILYGPRKMPITLDVSISGSELHVSPDEGTA